MWTLAGWFCVRPFVFRLRKMIGLFDRLVLLMVCHGSITIYMKVVLHSPICKLLHVRLIHVNIGFDSIDFIESFQELHKFKIDKEILRTKVKSIKIYFCWLDELCDCSGSIKGINYTESIK